MIFWEGCEYEGSASISGFGEMVTFGHCGGMACVALDGYFGPLAVPRVVQLPQDGSLGFAVVYRHR